MPLSSTAESLLRASAARAAVGRGPALPGDAKARLLAEFARRGSAPASRARLLLDGIRWPAASLSAASAAAAILLAGSVFGGIDLSDFTAGAESVDGSGRAGNSGRAGDSDLAASLHTPAAGPTRAASQPESALAWERFHPLPSSAPRVRVVDDQNLSLIGVGWTPDLDGP